MYDRIEQENKIPIFVVNLKKDIEKKEHMIRLCKQHSLECHFIDAVYGRDLDENYIEQITDREKSIRSIGRELTPGELGCTLSHISIYKKMIEMGNAIAIIFEDDIVIETDFKNVIDSISRFPTDWECVLLGHYADGMDEVRTLSSFWWRKKITETSNIVRLVEQANGTHGYIINLKGIRKLLANMSVISSPIDTYTGNDKKLNLYGIDPPCIRLDKIHAKNSNIIEERDAMREKYSNGNIEVKKDGFLKRLLKKCKLFYMVKEMKASFFLINKKRKIFLLKMKKPKIYN